MPRIRTLVLALMVLSVIGIHPSFAQTSPTQTGQTPDGKLAFDYPADWASDPLDNQPFVTYVANGADIFDRIQAGNPIDVGEIVMVIYSPDLYSQEIGAPSPLTALDAAQLLYPIPNDNSDFNYLAPTPYFVNGRPAARVDYTGPDSQGMAFFVELGDGTVGTVIGVALRGEVEQFLPNIFAVAQSMRPGDGVAAVPDSEPDTPPTEEPADNPPPVEVSVNRFVNDAGTLSFQYPTEWSVEESPASISIAATAEMRDRIVVDPSAMQPDDFLVSIIGPTALTEILATAGATTLEAAANDYMADIAGRFDAEVLGPQALTLGNKSTLRYIVNDDAIDYFAIFVEMPDDQIVTVNAVGLKGSLAQYEEQILEIVTSLQLGGSSVALSPYTSANGKFSMSLPEGWVVREVAGYIVAANSESALNHLVANQALTSGETGILIYTTPLLELVLPVPTNSLPNQALTGFTRAYQRPDVTYGPIENPDGFTAFATITGSGGDGSLYVVNTHGFENTVFIGLGAAGEYFQYEAILKDVIASFVAVGEE